MSKNIKAFLDMLAYSEGTQTQGHNNGYDVMVGSRPGRFIRIDSFDDHPRITVQLSDTLWSSAAGRYQFIVKTWDELVQKIGLTDFGPLSQDKAAIELIRERDAIKYIEAGKIGTAIAACSTIWASLPGNSYGQNQHSLDKLISWYTNAGGSVSNEG